MLHFLYGNSNRTLDTFSTRLLEDKGQGMVYAPSSLLLNGIYVRMSNIPPRLPSAVTIVICTYGRAESLETTLESLTRQNYRDFEVVLITEKGDLPACRQKGLDSACGDIVSFIDDDVYCPPGWLEGVVKSFRQGVVGVSGPTTITKEYQKNRDCFKYKTIRRIQERLFKVSSDPGKLSPCGAPSMASNFERHSQYEGEVDYLECCNMSVKKQDALAVGGFDKIYTRTGEWAELDLSLKLGKFGELRFSPDAGLYHRPSKQGIYKSRLQTKHRWDNFRQFQLIWIKPSLRRTLYWIFIWTYFKAKELKMI